MPRILECDFCNKRASDKETSEGLVAFYRLISEKYLDPDKSRYICGECLEKVPVSDRTIPAF